MKPPDTQHFAALVQWNKDNGGFLDPAVEVYNDPVTNLSLRVKPDASALPAAPSPAIVACPLSTTLSFLNALTGSPLSDSSASPTGSNPPTFPLDFLQAVPPHVISRFFLIQQYLLGPRSHWHSYIATLPQPQNLNAWNLPAFWPEEDAALLLGTNAGVAAAEMAANAASESEHARRALRDSGFDQWKEYSPILYRWAYCIFTSRSFRPSLVVPAPVWASLQQDFAPYLQGCALDDFSILMPLFDLANHNPLVEARWDTESVLGQCQLLVHSRNGSGYKPGDQIFNNYGLKTNSELLVAYGFILPESDELHNDYVHLRLQSRAIESEDAKTPPKPRDFLISLHPLSDPRSIVGRARQWIQDRRGLIPDFEHYEDALLWLFCEASTRGNRPAEQDQAENPARLASILANPTPPEHRDLIESLREFLLAKAQSDYIKVSEGGCEAMEELLDRTLSENQTLAAQYLQSVVRVLQNAMVSLDPTITFEFATEDDEEGP